MNFSSKKQYAMMAAIPILGVVLYAVFPRTEKVATNEKRNSQSDALDNPSRIPRQISTALLTKEKRPEWPVYSSTEISTIDPFDKGMIFRESAIRNPNEGSLDSSQQNLVSSSTLTQQATKVSDVKIQAIFRSSRGVAALVDTRLIHVGDRLNDGTEVTEITPEQLIVVVPKVE
jgi:hypothetical protein